MKVKDIPGDAMFISDSQDVSPILADFGIVDDDIGGVFITKDGKVYGTQQSMNQECGNLCQLTKKLLSC